MGDRREDTGAPDLDVIGIGALNLDYIVNTDDLADTPAKRDVLSRIAEILGDDSPWGTEVHVDDATIRAALRAAGGQAAALSLGGSAFNAIHTMASTGLGLRLGYVGVAGRVPIRGLSTVDTFERLNVDHTRVHKERGRLSGVCLSLVDNGDRTLLTHSGANARMADYLRDAFDDLAGYLSRARVLHVTSFLDGETAPVLHLLLREVKARNGSVLISFDPGHVWCTDRTLDIEGIMSISDYLLLNRGELRALAPAGNGMADEEIAAALLKRFENPQGIVLLKTSHGIRTFAAGPDGVRDTFYPQRRLAPEEIKDSTGAGDVFAAGLLAALADEDLQLEFGALLGMELVRAKLRYEGSQHHARLAGVTHEFMRRLSTGRRGRGVFISHGNKTDWLAVMGHLKDELRVRVEAFESREWASRPVTEALENYLDRFGLAICVITGEDCAGERRMTRQNVTHEVGLFQGRYGYDRVIALVEEGCELTADLPASHVIAYPVNRIGDSFYVLRKLLRSMGLGRTGEADGIPYGHRPPRRRA